MNGRIAVVVLGAAVCFGAALAYCSARLVDIAYDAQDAPTMDAQRWTAPTEQAPPQDCLRAPNAPPDPAD